MGLCSGYRDLTRTYPERSLRPLSKSQLEKDIESPPRQLLPPAATVHWPVKVPEDFARAPRLLIGPPRSRRSNMILAVIANSGCTTDRETPDVDYKWLEHVIAGCSRTSLTPKTCAIAGNRY